MKKLLKHFDNIVPLWAVAPLLLCLIVNSLVYWITMALCGDFYHYDFTLSFDNSVPFVTEWIWIYLGYSYVFWVFSYCYIAHIKRNDKAFVFRFLTADILSRVVCLCCFIFLPTTNIRPAITGTSVSDDLTRLLHRLDQPVNLFPSIHCLVSWLCFVGVRRIKEVRISFKLFSFISAVLIMLSTQFLKQHYIVDMLAGIALAEACFYICKYIPLPQLYMRGYMYLYTKLGGYFGPKEEKHQ